MNQSDKYASIPSVMLADDLADYLIEVSEKFLIISINNNKYIQFFFFLLFKTTLYAFTRSEFQDPELWNKLAIQLSFSVRWYQTISQWTVSI